MNIGEMFRKAFRHPADRYADEREDQPGRELQRKTHNTRTAAGDHNIWATKDEREANHRSVLGDELYERTIGARMKGRINAKKVPRDEGEETVRPAGTKMGVRG